MEYKNIEKAIDLSNQIEKIENQLKDLKDDKQVLFIMKGRAGITAEDFDKAPANMAVKELSNRLVIHMTLYLEDQLKALHKELSKL